MGAEDVGRADQVPHLGRLEARVHQIRDAGGQELQQPAGVLVVQPAHAQAEARQVLERPQPAVERRRRLHEERLEVRRQPLDLGVELQEGAGVLGRDRLDPGGGPSRVLVQEQGPAAAARDEQERVARGHPEAVLREPQVADDLGAHHAGDVGGGRGAEAGGDLLGDAGAADEVAPLEHAHFQPGARQEARGHQAVVPAADDDGVAGGHAMTGSSLYFDRRSSPFAKRSNARGEMSMLVLPSRIISAISRPVTGASLKPWPEKP